VAWVQILLQGVLTGGLYALFAMGQSLVFGVMRMTNTAHGDFIILASFGALSLIASGAAGGPLVAGVVLVPIACAVGYGLQRLLLNRTLGADPLPSLVVTFGLSIMIQNALQEAYSADPRAIESGALATASIDVAPGLALGVLPLAIFCTAILAAFSMQWLFARTRIGRAFRAVSDDREVAELMGLDHRHVYALATAVAFGLVAVAGTLHGMRTTFAPSDGPALLLYAFEAVIMGGMGSFWGTFFGGILLGVSQAIGFRLDPGWGIWLGHVVFLCVLLVRPTGLFPKTR
jgi:branched-chain amino acid transport system permease protein